MLVAAARLGTRAQQANSCTRCRASRRAPAAEASQAQEEGSEVRHRVEQRQDPVLHQKHALLEAGQLQGGDARAARQARVPHGEDGEVRLLRAGMPGAGAQRPATPPAEPPLLWGRRTCSPATGPRPSRFGPLCHEQREARLCFLACYPAFPTSQPARPACLSACCLPALPSMPACPPAFRAPTPCFRVDSEA